jgi:hypothetical protein
VGRGPAWQLREHRRPGHYLAWGSQRRWGARRPLHPTLAGSGRAWKWSCPPGNIHPGPSPAHLTAGAIYQQVGSAQVGAHDPAGRPRLHPGPQSDPQGAKTSGGGFLGETQLPKRGPGARGAGEPPSGQLRPALPLPAQFPPPPKGPGRGSQARGGSR